MAEQTSRKSQSSGQEAARDAFIAALPEAAFQIDLKGTIVGYHPPSDAGHPCFPAAGLAGKNIREIHGDFAAATMEHLSRALETGQAQTFDRTMDFSGKRCCLSVSLAPYSDREVIAVVKDVTAWAEKEHAIREANGLLASQAAAISDADAALRALLDHHQRENQKQREKISAYVNAKIVPHLELLAATHLDEGQRELLTLISHNLRGLLSASDGLDDPPAAKLTAVENQIADMVRSGKTNKEIAVLMNLSTHTVAAHRRNIRNKLGLKNKKVNLRDHLNSKP